MNVLIIEDEEPTARKLKRLLEEVEPTARVVGVTGSVVESVDWLEQHRTPAGPVSENALVPDLILMDIELADGQSFEIFRQTPVASPVIFITAYDEYAIKAFKVNSIDYLLKPVKEADLRQALAKLQSLKELLSPEKDLLQTSLVDLLRQMALDRQNAVRAEDTAVEPFRKRFLIKQGQRLFPIPIDEVAYFFTRNKIAFIKTYEEGEWMLDYTMDELEKMLDPRRFFRLNRQIIAEIRAVDKVHLYFNGKLKVGLRPYFADEVVVSRERAGEFKGWLGA